MTTTVRATFDGEVLRPEEPVPLKPNTRVRLTIETEEERKTEPVSFFKVARSLKLEGPPDWAARFEEYLRRDKTDRHE